MRRRTRGPWWGLAALVLVGCGEREDTPAGPPLPFNKIPPTLPRLVRERTLAEWLERAQSPDAARRAEAPWALVELTSEPGAIAPTLERLLADPSPHVRYAAAVAVGRSPGNLGPEVMRALVALLGATEPGLASAVRTSLTEVGEGAVPALIERLGQEDLGLVRLVLRALGEIGPPAAAATEAVLNVYGQRGDQRDQAVWALERFGPAAVPALVARLRAAPDDEAAVLLSLLPASGTALSPHVEALIAALRRSAPVRRAAGDALLSAGAVALPALERLAQDPDHDVSAHAASLAQQIRSATPR